MPTHASQVCCCQCPCPHGRPLLTTSLQETLKQSWQVWLSLLWVTTPFPWVLVHTGFFLCVCPLRVSVSPSPLGVEELNPFVLQSQIPWGFPIPLPDPQVGKSVLGPRTFAGSLVLLFSSLWVAHLEDMGFDFIMIAPLLPSH